MKKIILISAILILVLFGDLFCANNVWLETYPHDQTIIIGCYKDIEIYISNDIDLTGISLGFEFSWDPSLTVEFDSTYSNSSNWQYIREENDAVGKFDLTNGIIVDARIDGISPDTILITGSASEGNGLPFNPGGSLRYSFSLFVMGPDVVSGFKVDNIIVPPSGNWAFDDGTDVFAPDYFGQSNSSISDPDASLVGFDVVICPCFVPIWTGTPEQEINQPYCQDFNFDFEAIDGGNNPPAYPLKYNSSVGVISEATGEFSLIAPGIAGCDSTQQVTVQVVDQNCNGRNYDFTINWTNITPQISNCPLTEERVLMGTTYSHQLAVDDDACDQHSYSVAHVGQAPVGTYQINTSSNFTFNADDADSGFTYTFEGETTDGCGATNLCQFAVKVGFICGDADQSGQVDISDAVYLIAYIFGGGPVPIPLTVGDTDCSEEVDISDAVYLISFIFSGGPPPCDTDSNGIPDC